MASKSNVKVSVCVSGVLLMFNFSCKEGGSSSETQSSATTNKLEPLSVKVKLNEILKKERGFTSESEFSFGSAYTVRSQIVYGENVNNIHAIPVDKRSEFCRNLDNGSMDQNQREMLRSLLEIYYDMAKMTQSDRENCLKPTLIKKTSKETSKQTTMVTNMLNFELSTEMLEILGGVAQSTVNVMSVRTNEKGQKLGRPSLGVLPAEYEPIVSALMATKVTSDPVFLGVVKFLVSGQFEYRLTPNLVIESCSQVVAEGVCGQVKFKTIF